MKSCDRNLPLYRDSVAVRVMRNESSRSRLAVGAAGLLLVTSVQAGTDLSRVVLAEIAPEEPAVERLHGATENRTFARAEGVRMPLSLLITRSKVDPNTARAALTLLVRAGQVRRVERATYALV